MFPFLQMSHADRRWLEKYVQAERLGSGDFSSGEMTSRQARIGLGESGAPAINVATAPQ
jgi:hypothetical protein